MVVCFIIKISKYLACDCNPQGSASGSCDSDGKCTDCKPNVLGDKCTACRDGYYGYPDCTCKNFEFNDQQ